MCFSSLAAAVPTTSLSITLHLFQYIDLLNPSFNCFTNFTLSSVDQVTTGTYSFASVIFKVALSVPVALALTGAVVNT